MNMDVICFGEALIDFIPTVSGVTLIEAPAFKKAPGGAPANVAAGLAKLGVSSAFMGKVGDDAFGHFLAQTLESLGVDVTPLLFSNTARTALAFVSLRADGEREFMFYRHPSADMLFEADDINITLLQHAKILHHGSISLISEPCRSATLKAIALAQQAGVLISFDPNLRLPLWQSADAAKAAILSVWQQANIIKVSEEELLFLTGIEDMQQAVRALWTDNLKVLVVTLGKQGCHCFTPQGDVFVPGFVVDCIDATGAGDAFAAGLLKGLLQTQQGMTDLHALKEICRYANATGAITTTARGAISALPTPEQVEELLKRQG